MDRRREHDVGVGKRFVGRHWMTHVSAGVCLQLHRRGRAVPCLVIGGTIALFARRFRTKGAAGGRQGVPIL